ncbi:MAG: D-glycero-beta-D-manno-heptose 1-phosphate adenylyltransferase [Acidobacteria bacterium]|nr:D-glycero-beta-D-manno-heptose 1-phosphate adenylyltransferase [Acidobacteriota bacterium]
MSPASRYFDSAFAFLQANPAWAPESRRGRLGFTNGCFDLLHPGHVAYLEEVRELCDFLVVGLNADASVARLKGPSRPVQDEAARAAVLLGLRSVDAVVRFAEDTPELLIRDLQPDLLAKGGDYTPSTVVGRDVVEGRGGRLVLLPFREGHSTSRIVTRIRSSRGVTLE